MTIAADEIILDPDMTLTDVIQATNIVTQSSTIPSDVSVNAPSQLRVDAGQSVSIALAINNNGPLTDTYRLTTSNTEAWSSSALPTNNITIAGLESTDLMVQLIGPTDVVSGLINTLILTATSQNNSDVTGVESIEIQAYNQIAPPTTVYLPIVLK